MAAIPPRRALKLPPACGKWRARRLAWLADDELTSTRLTDFAQVLEARAAALEPPATIVSHDDAAALQQSDPDFGQN